MLSKVFLFQSYINKSFPHYFCMQHCYFTVQWPKQHYSALHAVRCRMQTPCCPGSRLKHWGIPLNNILHIIYVLLSIGQKAREDWRVKTSLTCVWKYLVQISTEETITLTKVVCNCTHVTEAERLYISWGQCRFLPTPFIFISNYHLFHLRSGSIMKIGGISFNSYFVLKFYFW